MSCVAGLVTTAALIGVPATSSAVEPVRIDAAADSRSKSPKIGRPVIQILSEHRQGDRTKVSVASIVPVKGAAAYRLEKYDPSRKEWAFQGKCERVCTRFFENASEGSTMTFRMRALDATGVMSKPSVAVGVTPKVWDSKRQPGATLDMNVGPLSSAMVGKAVREMMIGLRGVCAFDQETRRALDAVIATADIATKNSKNIYVIVGSEIASFAKAYYEALYQTHCEVIDKMAASWVAADQRVEAGGRAKFSINTEWTATPVKFLWWDTPVNIWTCNVDVQPATGVGSRLNLGMSDNGESCMNMATKMWQIYN